MTLRQWQADVDEELAIGDYVKATTHLPTFNVRPPQRGGAEQVGGRSLLLSVTVDVLVLGWFVFNELATRARRWSRGRAGNAP